MGKWIANRDIDAEYAVMYFRTNQGIERIKGCGLNIRHENKPTNSCREHTSWA